MKEPRACGGQAVEHAVANGDAHARPFLEVVTEDPERKVAQRKIGAGVIGALNP